MLRLKAMQGKQLDIQYFVASILWIGERSFSQCHRGPYIRCSMLSVQCSTFPPSPSLFS